MQSDKQIIEKVKAGEIEEFSKLIRKYSNKMFALAKSLVKSNEDAEEITQDVFIKAFKALETFRGDAKFSSFLYRICYNESLNFIKKRKIHFELKEEIVPQEYIKNQYFNLERKEQQYYLKQALNLLSDDNRIVLTMFYLEEYSYKEIVELTGFSLANVKVKIHRAKAALAKAMNQILNEEVKNII